MFYTEKQTKNNMRARRACESASILNYQWWKRAQIQKYQFTIFTKKQLLVCAPHLTSPHLTSPHLTSPHLTSPHLTSPHLTK